MYGSLVTPGVFEDMTKTSILLSDYQNDYKDSLTYTDEEISQYYEDHKSTFDVAAYDYIRFTGSATSTKDASGNTVEPTDEQTQAAKDAAKAAADAALARFQNGEDLETISKDYDIASFVTQDEGLQRYRHRFRLGSLTSPAPPVKVLSSTMAPTIMWSTLSP